MSIKFENFSIISKADPANIPALCYNRTPAQAAAIERRKVTFVTAMLDLRDFCEKQRGGEIKAALLPVLEAYTEWIEHPSFTAERNDSEIIGAISKLMTINTAIFADIKERYLDDCEKLAQKIESKVYGESNATAYSKLSRTEKKNKEKRENAAKTEKQLTDSRAEIGRLLSKVLSAEKEIAAKKQKIAATSADSAALLTLREIKQLERQIAESSNLIDLNNRIIESIETENYLAEKGRLLSETDSKKQLRLISEANKLHEKERYTEKYAAIVRESTDRLTAAPQSEKPTADELSELRALRIADAPLSAADRLSNAAKSTDKEKEKTEKEEEATDTSFNPANILEDLL